jgi:hypothetical protein
MDEKRQREEFIGDRIYGACLVKVLEQWRLPRRCISLFYSVFTSNVYQERLFRKMKIPEFLVESSQEILPGKPCADALEVRSPQYSFIMVIKLSIDILFTRFKRPVIRILSDSISEAILRSSSTCAPPTSGIRG